MPVKLSTVAKITKAAQTRRNSPRGSATRQNGNNSMNSEGNSHGRKRKTKVKKAKRSKRGSQKKRGRRASRRQRGGDKVINKYCSNEEHVDGPGFEWENEEYNEYYKENKINAINEIANAYADESGDFKGKTQEKKKDEFVVKFNAALREGFTSRKPLRANVTRFVNEERFKEYIDRKVESWKNAGKNYPFFESLFGTPENKRQKIKCFLKYD